MPETTGFRTLPAGPKLDAIVAERVLGWTRTRVAPISATGCRPEHNYERHGASAPIPGYSTTWYGAGAVVEAMERQGYNRFWVAHEWHGTAGFNWTAAFWKQPPDRNGPFTCYAESNADTAPLAICRAALAALEVPS